MKMTSTVTHFWKREASCRDKDQKMAILGAECKCQVEVVLFLEYK